MPGLLDSRPDFHITFRQACGLPCGGGLLHTIVPMIGPKTFHESCRAHNAITFLHILHFINSIPTGFRVRIVSVLSLSYEQIYSGHMK